MHKPHSIDSLRSRRAVLTAGWRNLVLLNFPASPEALAPYTPPGVELDLFGGQALLSIVGFSFLNSRLWGVRVPGYGRFAEVNLRFYVRRRVDGSIRRGVVFIREIAPKRGLAVAARLLYQEKYLVRPMRNLPENGDCPPPVGSAIEYQWRDRNCWSRVGARVAGLFALPQPGSPEEFVIEHYWGYTLGRREECLEYQVDHPPWRVAAASDVAWECDAAATYGPVLAEYLSGPPASVMIAEGSDVAVYGGRRLV